MSLEYLTTSLAVRRIYYDGRGAITPAFSHKLAPKGALKLESVMNLLERLRSIAYAGVSSEVEQIKDRCDNAAAAGATEITVPAHSVSKAALSYLRNEGLQVYEQYGNILISWE
jgi:hypothetical protein